MTTNSPRTGLRLFFWCWFWIGPAMYRFLQDEDTPLWQVLLMTVLSVVSFPFIYLTDRKMRTGLEEEIGQYLQPSSRPE